MSIQTEKRNIGKMLLIIIAMGVVLYLFTRKPSGNLHIGQMVAHTSFVLNIDISTPYLHIGSIDVKTMFDMTSSISP